MSKQEREALGQTGREYVLRDYGFDKFCSEWDRVLTHLYEKHGSWENRKNYKPWSLMEIA